jgi:methylphosphotriester-DNA--protein-cysteine methyltransferase
MHGYTAGKIAKVRKRGSCKSPIKNISTSENKIKFDARKTVDIRASLSYVYGMQTPSCNAMIKALRANDARYDGKFYVGVKTTRIYWLPSCKAKQPMLVNVVFFATKKDAIAAGFRGCKRCRSEFYPNVEPPWWSGVLSYMRAAPQSKIAERDIAAITGVDISTVRRYFKSCLMTTPMAFHRKMRLAYARSRSSKARII